jgi:hypothetical protein
MSIPSIVTVRYCTGSWAGTGDALISIAVAIKAAIRLRIVKLQKILTSPPM